MNRIKELREEAGLRQSDVAQAVGIDQRTLSNYETGKTNPDSFAIIKLADFFHVSADYLICHNTMSVQEQIEKELDTIERRIENIRSKVKQI